MLPLFLTIIPIVIILLFLLVFKKAADISGIAGWLAIALIMICRCHEDSFCLLTDTDDRHQHLRSDPAGC